MKGRIIWCLRNFIPMAFFPVADFYLFEWYTHNPWETMKLPIQFLNICFFELSMLLLLFLFGRLKWALRMQSIFFMAVGLANYYVLSFRSTPIMPWDLCSIGTAAGVADNFKYTVEKQTLLVLAGFLLLIMAESFASLRLGSAKDAKRCKIDLHMGDSCAFLSFRKPDFRMPVLRAAGTAVSAALLCSFTHMLHQDSTVIKYGIYDKLFTPAVMSRRDGTAVAFLMELKYLSVDKPDGYSARAAREILAPYDENDVIVTAPASAPNIIVIMNEAFSDPAVLGRFETNEDYMPYVHSILEGTVGNTISGYLNVSVLGGNTANTEFEFLTGNSMAFLPQGSVPYQQYLKRELPSLASRLRDIGYQTIAAHPYNSTGWERNKVYPLLGFDESYFIRDYQNPEKIRKYVSDRACYGKIIELYETKADGTPMFVFNVTMQNHSSYTEEFDNFRPDIKVSGSSSKALRHYLSLMKRSDEALRSLISYFSQAQEDTVIVFFGDHQPTDSVVSDIWKLNGKSGKELSEEDVANRYKVPYFIWCNYDIGIRTGRETSANFLATDVLAAAGLTPDSYGAYLDGLSRRYPVVTAIRTENSSGQSADMQNAMEGLNSYAVLQYDRLFGSP